MDVISYVLSKKIAEHAVSGVQSMSVNGQTLIINTKDSGVLTMTFPTPKDGVSVTDIDVNANNQIVFTMSDGTEFISGRIPTIKGDPGVSPIITENADNTDKIYKLDITTADSTFTTPNLKGADGQGGTGGEENKIDSISVNGVNVTPDENKNVDITVPKVTNDLTDELKSSYDEAVAAKHTHDNKTVLDSITAEKVEAWDKAEENIQADWNETDDTADGFIKNKPTIPDITGLATKTYVDNKVADYTKTVDLADVARSGSYNDLADKPTIPSLDGYAKTTEIPSKVSELENDSNYLSSIPEEYVTDTELESKGYLTEHQDISGKVDKVEGKSLISDTEIARLATVDNYDDTDIKAEIAKKADTTAIPSKVSELTNDSNYQTAEQVSSTVTTEIAKVVAGAPEDLNTLKEMSDWIAGHENDASAMNSAISDNKTAITALQTGKADKSEIPTTVAELTDSADYAKKTDLHSHDNKTVLDGITSTKVSDWDSAKTHADSAHAPSNAQVNVIETVKVNGTTLTPSAKAVNIAVPTVGNGIITIKQAGVSKGAFTMNQSGNTTIELTDNNTTYSNFVKSGSDAKAGLVPAPSTTAGTTKYLREDGTWTVPPDTNTTYSVATTSANGLMSSSDKSKLDGIASGAEVNQNAYSKISVVGDGAIVLSADEKESSVEFDSGTGINIGFGSNSHSIMFTNTGVTNVNEGAKNGTINVTLNGETAVVPVKGLGSAAYTNSGDYLSKSGGTVKGTLTIDKSGTSSNTPILSLGNSSNKVMTYIYLRSDHPQVAGGWEAAYLYEGGKSLADKYQTKVHEVVSSSEPSSQVSGDYWLEDY